MEVAYVDEAVRVETLYERRLEALQHAPHIAELGLPRYLGGNLAAEPDKSGSVLKYEASLCKGSTASAAYSVDVNTSPEIRDRGLLPPTYENAFGVKARVTL